MTDKKCPLYAIASESFYTVCQLSECELYHEVDARCSITTIAWALNNINNTLGGIQTAIQNLSYAVETK